MAHIGSGVLDRVVVQAGDTVFSEGDTGDRAYVVQDGLIEIVKEVNGEQVVLGTIEKGGIFGEMALIDNQPRMASARAATMATVIVVGRDVFSKKLAKCDPFIKGLLGIFVRNLRSITQERVESGQL